MSHKNSTVSDNHSKGGTHHHEHEHHHGNKPVLLFFIGLVAFFIALFVKKNTGIQAGLFIFATFSSGYHIIMEGFSDTYYTSRSLKKFSPNVHILMTFAAFGAMIIGNFEEAALLILIFAAAHFLEDYAKDRSKREITNLLDLNPTKARLLLDDGSTKIVEVNSLQIGDTLQVLHGDQIPTDGIILSGIGSLDESSINGESMPKEKTIGEEVFGSTVNINGSFTMKVTKETSETLFAKIVQLVTQSQSNLSKTATKIQQMEPYYVKIVLMLVPLFILISPILFKWSWYESFYRGMVLLISASPCALAASAIPATLAGISNLAKRGVLFKGGTFLANLANIQVVAFDKTGTLTQGKPSVTDIYFDPTYSGEKQELINLIVAMEKTANHPLAAAILEKFTATKALNLTVENIVGKGLLTKYNGHSYQIGKPETMENIDHTLLQRQTTYINEGKTVVFVTKDQHIVALIALMDQPNSKAKGVINYLKEQDIHTVMITGDSEVTGKAIANQLDIDQIIGNVLPENKAQIVKEQQKTHGMTAMLGDGINDAPALVTADIGVAMGEGTDIAIDVADVVLMQNNLEQFSYAHKISKKLNRVIWQNIVFSMSIVALLVTLNLLGRMDITIGVLAHEGSTILVLFNGLRLLLPLKS